VNAEELLGDRHLVGLHDRLVVFFPGQGIPFVDNRSPFRAILNKYEAQPEDTTPPYLP